MRPSLVAQQSLTILEAALARRRPLLADPTTTVARLLDGAGDGLPGLVIEKLGDVLVAQLHEGRLRLNEPAARAVCQAAAERVDARAVYRKIFPRDRSAARPDLGRLHTDPTPWIGEPVPPEFTVRESGLTYWVRPYDGYAAGLYLDHRTQRDRLRGLAAGRRVLNAFAYTCGFTVACAAGGAALVASVDVSRRYLAWGKRNLATNGLGGDTLRFYCSDISQYLRRARRQGHAYDLVILDPPTFGRARHSRATFALESDLAALVQGAVELLDRGGILHLSVNDRGITQAHLRSAVRSALASFRRPCALLDPPAAPLGFTNTDHIAPVILAQG